MCTKDGTDKKGKITRASQEVLLVKSFKKKQLVCSRFQNRTQADSSLKATAIERTANVQKAREQSYPIGHGIQCDIELWWTRRICETRGKRNTADAAMKQCLQMFSMLYWKETTTLFLAQPRLTQFRFRLNQNTTLLGLDLNQNTRILGSQQDQHHGSVRL